MCLSFQSKCKSHWDVQQRREILEFFQVTQFPSRPWLLGGKSAVFLMAETSCTHPVGTSIHKPFRGRHHQGSHLRLGLKCRNMPSYWNRNKERGSREFNIHFKSQTSETYSRQRPVLESQARQSWALGSDSTEHNRPGVRPALALGSCGDVHGTS